MKVKLATSFEVTSTQDEDEAIKVAEQMIRDQLKLGFFGDLSWEVERDADFCANCGVVSDGLCDDCKARLDYLYYNEK